MTNRPPAEPGNAGGNRGYPVPRWLHERATGLVARLRERGMTLTVDAAETFLAERHYTVAKQLGITEHSARSHLDEGALDALADRLVATFATEEPGVDLFALPRSAGISVASFGRLIAGLAETLQFYESYPALDDADRRARTHETAQLLSLAGLIQSEHANGAISAPPALFSRIARTLTTVADLPNNAALADALRRDAMCATFAAITHDA